MDIHLLRTFVAAFEEASFTKAARRLYATQPGVSVQIATLEAHIGTPLFHRNARSVTPTLAGRRLYPRAVQLIQDLKSATQEIQALAGAVVGHVSVGVPPVLSSALMPPLLSRYLAAYPQCEVRIVEGHADGILPLVESGRLDFALATRSLDRAQIAEINVCRDRVVMASGPQSRLGACSVVHLDAEPRQKIVVPAALRHTLDGMLKNPLRSGQIVPERVIEVDGLACALEFVAQTDWVALVPASAACIDTNPTEVRFHLIAGDEIDIDYFIVHACSAPPSVAAQVLIDMTVAELTRQAPQWEVRARRHFGAQGINANVALLNRKPRTQDVA